MLYCVIGASGTGKSTLVEEAMKRYKMERVITCTTRERREGEPSDAYYFLSDDEFDRLENGGLVESDSYHGHRYGTAYFAVDRALDKGDAFIITTAKGYENLRKMYECRGVVLEIPVSELRKRMEGRGDSEENIESRLSGIEQEMEANRRIRCPHLNLSGNRERDLKLFLDATLGPGRDTKPRKPAKWEIERDL